ncbi:TetR/AcrR family transcriptional regulator [Kitasatospora acidiphila]|uniref:TetR/AcrR family transcriptional regulator n=1 Tax=Kitasatospora acidiphila TaxID=2567942 RepID=A0A540W2N6_9ACTN|nr:TetR/AcrR family transcriptional regulator [Kitasatospora acidiphila]TQF03281.1 TetR/AcrR family transcriptional regulator [Kitasatospora acidiphila]
MSDTRERLMAAAISLMKRQGISGVSARTIAAECGANQALVFYHFKTVEGLLAAAAVRETENRLALYRPALAAAGSLRELLRVGRELHETERADGSVALLGQFLAGASTYPQLAEASVAALRLWTDEVEAVLLRLFADHPLAELLDLPGLARAVSASFIGLELYEGVDPAGAAAAFEALDRLGVLVEVVDGLGPVANRAVRVALRRSATRTANGG